MSKTRTILVDDHAIVREGLASLLSTTPDFDIVRQASDGAEAINLARELTPDLVVIDLLMPGVNGVTAISGIRASCPDITVAVLTSSEESDLALAAIEAGAHAFLLKSMSGDELLAALRRVAQGEVVIHPAIAKRLLQAAHAGKASASDPFAELTERETEVLRVLAQGASNARLAAQLDISEKTVKSHIGAILSKLQLADRTEAVAYAWRHGLVRD